MADTATIKGIKKKLIRKALAGSVLIADEDAVSPTAFTSGANATFTIPAGFTPLGAISRDGSPVFTPETESSDVESWGELEATRTDLISRNMTVAWTGQETHKRNLELYHGVDLSAITADATTSEVAFSDPTDPATRYFRAIFIGIDGRDEDAIYMIKYLPRLTISEVSEMSFNTESPVEYGFTGRAKVDDDLGFSVLNVFGGPGWKALGDLHGFDAETP